MPKCYKMFKVSFKIFYNYLEKRSVTVYGKTGKIITYSTEQSPS